MESIVEEKSQALESKAARPVQRRFPAGAEVQPGGGTHFRVWAPGHHKVTLHLGERMELHPKSLVELEMEPGGYFSAFVPEARAGMFYKYRLETGEFPDPVSRFQPHGPH